MDTKLAQKILSQLEHISKTVEWISKQIEPYGPRKDHPPTPSHAKQPKDEGHAAGGVSLIIPDPDPAPHAQNAANNKWNKPFQWWKERIEQLNLSLSSSPLDMLSSLICSGMTRITLLSWMSDLMFASLTKNQRFL